MRKKTHPAKPRAGKCKTCGADIYWAISIETGKLAPIDVATVSGGNVLLTYSQGTGMIKYRVLGKGESAGDAPTRLNHWTTCASPPAKDKASAHKGGTPA